MTLNSNDSLTYSQKLALVPRYKRLFRTLITLPIVVYQKTMSFDHGPMRVLYPYGFCRFYPSCSEYCRRSIILHGVVHGGVNGFWRITRCNPWHEPGVDEP